jgi:hypothetical protein
VPHFGEECVIRIFNNKWQFREQGVRMFNERMSQAFTEASSDQHNLLSLNTAVLQTLIEIYKDKVQQIVNLSFEAAE